MSKPARILHCHSTFSAGGKEVRCAKLINALGQGLTHDIVSAMPSEMGAKELIDPARASVAYPIDFPALTGRPTPWRLVTLAKALKPYDLVLTYNWGAMDIVMARTVYANHFDLPPLIHHEDGFNADEAQQLKTSRNWYRRVALNAAHSLVVPSRTLEQIAHRTWKQPCERVERIPNGIDTAAFARSPDPSKLRLVKREGERWVGTLAGLRPVKQLPLLVNAMNEMPENWHLVILGDGPERDAILQAASDLELSHRVHLPGAIPDPHEVIGLFDIFALSSQSEQFPLSVVEAMAAGLPVVAPDVGDVKSIVSDANRDFITVRDSVQALSAMLEEFAANPELRRGVGMQNREKAVANFDFSQMAQRYASLYSSALGGRWSLPA